MFILVSRTQVRPRNRGGCYIHGSTQGYANSNPHLSNIIHTQCSIVPLLRCVLPLLPCVLPILPRILPLLPCVVPLLPCVQYHSHAVSSQISGEGPVLFLPLGSRVCRSSARARASNPRSGDTRTAAYCGPQSHSGLPFQTHTRPFSFYGREKTFWGLVAN